MRPHLVVRLFLLLAAALLFACSGGSGGPAPAATSPAPTPTPTPPPTLAVLSGQISAPDFAVMDSDVNDPNAPCTANNDIDHAQALPNPAVVGGYATATATGKAGDTFAYEADHFDFYLVTLAAGQSITLSISDYSVTAPSAVDLNLFLLDGNHQTVASSLGDNATETITVAENGDYVIEVEAENGSSNYVLTVGQPTVACVGEEALRLEDDFVPGEILVHFMDKQRSAGVNDSLHDRAVALGLVGRAGAPGRVMRMGLSAAGQGGVDDYHALGASVVSDEMRARLDTIRELKKARRRADVDSASLNYIRKPFVIPDDSSYPLQWNFPLINLPQAWEVTTDAAGAVIEAVVDTGVFMAHPDLAANLLDTGYDFIRDLSTSNDGNGIDPNPDDPGDHGLPSGLGSFHGTHVAGIAAAVSNNILGVAGVAWHSKIMPVRVLGIGGGTSYDVMQGVRYAAGLANDSGTVPPRKADVINLSMGGGSYSSVEQSTFNAVRQAGVIVVAAAGNKHSASPSYPAAYAGVVSVAAVDRNKNQASYSNYGSTVDVAAPGGGATKVYSTCADDSSGTRQPTYASYAGTSMATPHVAGVVALMKSIYPALTPDQFDTLLASGAITEDLAGNGAAVRDDKFGYGLIDALKAVQQASLLAAAGGLETPILSVTPNQLVFGLATTQLTVTVANAGIGTLVVQGVTDNAAWLTVSPLGDVVNGVGTYTVTVDRTGLVAANYSAEITFTSTNGGTLHLPVTMAQSGQAAAYGNTGFLYILLVDPLTQAGVATQTATNVHGVYTYSFTGVKAGNYIIVATSDSNNNGVACDLGEACGEYPTVGLPQVVTVTDSNLAHLNFATSFLLAPLPATSALAASPGGK